MRIADGAHEKGICYLLREWFWNYHFYPPGFSFATAPAFILFGHTIKAGIAWQIFFPAGFIAGRPAASPTTRVAAASGLLIARHGLSKLRPFYSFAHGRRRGTC